MFNEKEEKILLDLFKIFSPSRNNERMIKFIVDFLGKNDIPFTKDTNGNIFSLHNEERPILSAHMDSVGGYDDGFLSEFINIFDYRGDRIMKGMGNIGGDDKCGVFLILMKLLEDKSLNFIFSIDEEIGCVGIKQVVPTNNISGFPYAIILDRRGNGDIICKNNDYGTKEFEDALAEVGKRFGYTPATGACSDANTIREYMSCANISVSYHNPHSKTEFVSLTELYNTKLYLDAIINELQGKAFTKPIISSYKGGTANTQYQDDDAYWQRTKGTGVTGSGSYRYNDFWCSVCRKYKPLDKKRSLKSKNKVALNSQYDGSICQDCLDEFIKDQKKAK